MKKQTKNKTSQIKKWTEDLNRHFPEKDNRYMKRCSVLLIIRETQVKTTIRCHFTLVRMAVTKKR